ncbi:MULTISPECIES: hypothetical protein [unclassified Agrobacterium]|uniref:hypothetical protein n=1 Tax=unclassified Agrobacterium TaxID=2632611 RepID=UPI00244C6719|nr:MULTISPECIES: hypothetical protein [unclassified Agrobacterium]MDH0613343.1 hypothetical protein [Agrobacterium sp. GD03872]MDH0697260.1 hypothetical protein [Agrobacterium sp. GD03871]MDH1062193.1 hypothetical protein [Agrobacterium sp. GD03992]MDH2211367.1 hypothetical protein [Agrobacterium sp. GD03643]MDH2220626.1 hypothetical protein [Agrobacterium sp. GD03638]
MFDRSLSLRGGDTYTTVTQQPHDAADAARLYGQLQDKATGSITEIIGHQLPDIRVEFVTYSSHRSIANFKDLHRVVFKINGQSFDQVIPVDEFETEREPHNKAALRKIAEAITNDLMNRLYPHVMEVYRRRF